MVLRRLIAGLIFLFAVSPTHARNATGPVANLAVIGTIPGPDGGWDLAAIDPETRRLYVAHGDSVMAVDLDSLKVNPKFVEGQRLHAVLPLPDGKALSTNGGNNTATIFEAATGKTIASVPTGQNPDAAIFDTASGLALILNGKSGDVTLIDPKTGTSPGRIAIGGKLELPAIDGQGRAYINIEDTAEIAVVDIAGRKVVTRYPLPGCEEPSGLALDPASGMLVTSCANGKALVLNAKDGKVVTTLTIGLRPDTVIFDPSRKVFFIPCGEGSLAVIGEKAGAAPIVIATIPTANGARTGALDAKTGRLYLPTADFEEPKPGERRHPVIPGTFRILIVGEK
jgi:DNA-binding beta-propeller fold protein YncE